MGRSSQSMFRFDLKLDEDNLGLEMRQKILIYVKFDLLSMTLTPLCLLLLTMPKILLLTFEEKTSNHFKFLKI